jgi:hypothetical protein
MAQAAKAEEEAEAAQEGEEDGVEATAADGPAEKSEGKGKKKA